MLSKIESYFKESARVKAGLTNQANTVSQIAALLEKVSRAGGTIYSCGNGGSACDSMHLTEELVAIYYRNRPGIRAQHFQDAGTLTCWSNDREFEGVFERQVETFLTKNDCLLCFTTSGNSKNILRAIAAATRIGAPTVALTGKGGGAAKAQATISLVVDSDTTSHIQEAHIAVVHMLCELVETSLFPNAVK
mgnify:CR=1 FL=1